MYSKIKSSKHEINHLHLSATYSGEGVQGQKLWKHNFEIRGGSKGPQQEGTFWPSFETAGPKAPVWRPRPFSSQNGPENQFFKVIALISLHQSIDNSFPSSHNKFQPDWSKND